MVNFIKGALRKEARVSTHGEKLADFHIVLSDENISDLRLSKLIIWDIQEKLKNADTKQTLTKLIQKYCICESRSYVRNSRDV